MSWPCQSQNERLPSAASGTRGFRAVRTGPRAILNALAQRLTILERVSDAVAATTEAYNLIADLAERNFPAHCADLADTCWHHSAALADAGRLDEARERAEQSAQIRRLLHSHNPKKYEFHLALSVLQLSQMRGPGKNSPGTRRLLAEAHQRLATLARTSPDAYMSDYGAASAEFATALATNGDVDAAITISRQAVSITGKLAHDGTPAAGLRYAVALDSYAQALLAAGSGRRSESRRASDEAASITERFMEAFLRDHPSELLTLLKGRSQRLFEIADYPAAVQAGEQLLDVLEHIAADDRIASSGRIADALVQHSMAVRADGDVHQSAELCLRAAASINLQATPQFATTKAHALSNAARVFVTLHEPEKAVQYAEEAVEILRGAARTDHPTSWRNWLMP